MESIPYPALAKIFSFCGPESRPICVCKQWEQIMKDSDIWCAYYQTYFPKSYKDLKDRKDARTEFIKEYSKVDIRRKVLNVVKAMHRLGYPAVLQCGYSMSGAFFRATLTIGDEKINDSWGSSLAPMFTVERPLEMSDTQLAKEIIAKHSIGRHKMYPNDPWMKWFNMVMGRISRWDFYYEFADWYEAPKGLPVECTCELPCNVPKDIPFYSNKLYN
eukprot:Phypoly_transcript_19849.p1 GENE.Phypoly_transcript_19849~~Phypoly_transcript_19849.p1  ORF type:complete len:235 (+),score=15.03 Phypoly_transcript_19849:55-705(+)